MNLRNRRSSPIQAATWPIRFYRHQRRKPLRNREIAKLRHWSSSAVRTHSATCRSRHLAIGQFCALPNPQFRNPAISHSLPLRSEEHTSELQSQSNLVCRLLLEKKKKKKKKKKNK